MTDRLAELHYQTVERIWDTAHPTHHNTSREFFDKIADEIQGLLRPDIQRLLDVGCGAGELMDALIVRGLDCSGFDFAQAKADAAQQIHPGRVWKQNFLDPYPHGPYDGVMSYGVLQYCRPVDMHIVVARTLAALKIGGQALHMAVPVMELFEHANGIHYDAQTETKLYGHRTRFMRCAMESVPVNDDGTFFHSGAKIAEIVTGLGHTIRAQPTGTSKYRMTFEIIRQH